MSTRTIVVDWDKMRPEDKFIEYTKGDGTVTRLRVERQVIELPTDKGAMGYATVLRDGIQQGDVLLVRIYDAADDHRHEWVAPFQNGTWHTMRDEHIIEFREMELRGTVLPGDVRDAVRDSLDEEGTESRSRLVDAITVEVLSLFKRQ